MEKIIELMKQAGISDTLAKGITEALNNYTKEQKAILESDYRDKMLQAKAVLVEEMNKFKTDLARKATIFFEAKSDKIEQAIAKQVAIRESASEGKLKQVAALVEGVQLNTSPQADLQALNGKIAALQNQLKVVTEERQTAVTKANRANTLASKLLQKNRELTLTEGKTTTDPTGGTPTTKIEGKTTPKIGTVAKPPITESIHKTGAQPTATHKVMAETIANHRLNRGGNGNLSPSGPGRRIWSNPDDIANSMKD